MLVSACTILACAKPLSWSARRGRGARAISEKELFPTRIRRLSNWEYSASVEALLPGTGELVEYHLPPDTRLEGYTNNDAQTVSSVYAARISSLVVDVTRLWLPPEQHGQSSWQQFCPGYESPRACALGLSAQAYRRQLEPSEWDAVRAEFNANLERYGPERALAVRIGVLLQSPNFMYLEELGDVDRVDGDGVVPLRGWELASNLAFAARGGPPDAELRELAASEALLDPDVREFQFRRLLSESETRHFVRQFFLQWLEVDRLLATAKDSAVAPRYDDYKAELVAETAAFVDEIMVHGGGRLADILNSGFTSLPAPVAEFYGLSPDSVGVRVALKTLQRRVGVLQHASFLAAHAHPEASSPVLRGDFVLRRLLCTELPRPGEFDIEVTRPPLDALKTTRSRIESHTENPDCKICHATIDPIGFLFEGFDAAGRVRVREQGLLVETRAEIELDGEAVQLEDSAALAARLATSSTALNCYARQILRFVAGRRQESAELAFVRQLQAMNPQPDSYLEILVAYVRSPLFVFRRNPR